VLLIKELISRLDFSNPSVEWGEQAITFRVALQMTGGKAKPLHSPKAIERIEFCPKGGSSMI
jgi:hypothetical protein